MPVFYGYEFENSQDADCAWKELCQAARDNLDLGFYGERARVGDRHMIIWVQEEHSEIYCPLGEQVALPHKLIRHLERSFERLSRTVSRMEYVYSKPFKVYWNEE